MHRVLLCDLDGTLVDTVADLAAALNAVLAQDGLPPLDEATVRGLVGHGAARLVADGFATARAPLAPDAFDSRLARFLAVYEAAPAVHSRLYPGVPATLRKLFDGGWRLGVCTNKPQRPSEAILEALDLSWLFTAVGGGDRFPARKPDGSHILATLETMDASPEHTVLVGDSVNDLRAARDAGIPVVLVDYGYAATPVHALDPDAVIGSFEQLPAVLGEILGH